MKKGLLTMIAALVVAMGANAQQVRTAEVGKCYGISANAQLVKTMTAASQQKAANHKKVARKAAATVDGEYVLNADNFEADFTESSLFTVTSATGTIKLDQYEGTPTFEYNVVLNDFTYEGAVVYGQYDAEEGIIEIPVQTIYEHPTYGPIVISGGYRIGDTNVGYAKEIVLIVNEDGSMDIDEDVTEENANETIGWVSFIPEYVDPDTQEEGGLWNFGFDIVVLKTNATMSYATTSAMFGGTGNGWARATMRVAVEDYDTEWVVNNFLGLTPMSITLNEDGTCSFPLGGKAFDHDRDEPYGYYRFVGITIEDPYIVRNYDKEVMNGFWADGVAEFYKVEYKEAWTDEDGEHEAGYYYVDDDDDYCRYITVATANDDGGSAYSLGYVCNISLQLDEPEEEGINDVTANAAQTGKTYNLMGQQLKGTAVKGLVVRDGKKLIVK